MEMFDARAAAWDTDYRTERARAIAEKIRSFVTGGGDTSAMEYGCGTGLVGFQLAGAFHSLLFVDASPGMIEQVRQKIDLLGLPGLSALCRDLVSEPMPGLRFDYIFSSLAMHHIKDTNAALSRFFELLKPGGHVLIVDLDEDDGSFHENEPGFDGHNGFKQEDLSARCGDAGFSKVYIETFYHNQKEVNGRQVPYSLFILDAEKQQALP